MAEEVEGIEKSLEFPAEEISAIMLQQKSILDIVSATLLILNKKSAWLIYSEGYRDHTVHTDYA